GVAAAFTANKDSPALPSVVENSLKVPLAPFRRPPSGRTVRCVIRTEPCWPWPWPRCCARPRPLRSRSRGWRAGCLPPPPRPPAPPDGALAPPAGELVAPGAPIEHAPAAAVGEPGMLPDATPPVIPSLEYNYYYPQPGAVTLHEAQAQMYLCPLPYPPPYVGY